MEDINDKEEKEECIDHKEEKEEYIEQPFFRVHPISGWDEENETWRCVECGTDMGPNNPRQVCGKVVCLFNS